jgi:hypothetical protein
MSDLLTRIAKPSPIRGVLGGPPGPPGSKRVPTRIEDRLTRMEDRLRGVEERLTRIETDIWWVRWIITGGVGLYVLRSIAEWIR